MKGFAFAIMTSVATCLLAVYGFNWWSLSLLIAGALSYQYTPERYERLVYEKLELENQLLKEQIKKASKEIREK